MRASLRHGVFALSAIFFSFTLQQLPAQSSSGTITGSVTDSTGAVVPGATVTILNPVSGYNAHDQVGRVGKLSVSEHSI